MVPYNLKMEENLEVYIATFVVILTMIVLFIIWSRRKDSRRDILLVGLCDSGKTLMFSRLLHDKFVNTYTSIKENIGHYVVGKDRLRIIDIPGHDRLHYKFFDNYKRLARGIVCVIDSVTLQSDIRDVAEFLYCLLTDPIVVSNCPKFLILCNKQDSALSVSREDVQTMLEKEINTLRLTKTSQLGSTHETDKKTTFLGKQETDFEFSHINWINVCFGEAAALNKDADRPAELNNLKEWLEGSL